MRHLPNQLPNAPPYLWVERDRRLVEEEDARAVHEGARDEKPALHAARQTPHGIAPHAFKLDEGEQFFYACAALRRPDMMQTRVQLKILARRQILVEVHLLRHDADQLLDRHFISSKRPALVENCTRSRLREHRQHADRRRLARAVRP